MRRMKWALEVLGAAASMAALAGCATSSHKSVRTYDYNNDPHGEQRAQPAEEPQDESQPHMVSPARWSLRANRWWNPTRNSHTRRAVARPACGKPSPRIEESRRIKDGGELRAGFVVLELGSMHPTGRCRRDAGSFRLCDAGPQDRCVRSARPPDRESATGQTGSARGSRPTVRGCWPEWSQG